MYIHVYIYTHTYTWRTYRCVCIYAPMQYVYRIPCGVLSTPPAKHSKFTLVTYVVLVWGVLPKCHPHFLCLIASGANLLIKTVVLSSTSGAKRGTPLAFVIRRWLSMTLSL